MAPNINNPGGVKNDPDEIRDGVVSDATRFPGGFIDEQITQAGAAVQIVGQFQLNNASFSQPFDVSPQDGAPTGLAFKPDGSQLYVVGNNNNNVYQYSLSTAYDISTASFSQSFDVSPQDGAPGGLVFKPDGSQLYICGLKNDNVFQYGLSTAFDVSTASFVRSFDVSPQDGAPTGLTFKPDGSQLYVVGGSNDNVYQYGLSTAFDISTASFSQSFDVSTQDIQPRGLVFKPDGSQLYVVGNNNDNVFQYGLSTAYDISTASFSQSFDISPQDDGPRGLAFKPDGSHLYISGISNDNVYQYAVGFVGAELG
jgi:DNA-binding beta-propeller fold protein YncE